MNITPKTKLFAVLGHPIAHSLSPAMHNASFSALKLDAMYVAFDVAPDRLMSVLPAMADRGVGGVNLTIPRKEVAYNGLELLDESAKRFGSVNTVKFADGLMTGYSTDGEGFLTSFYEEFDTSVKDKSVFMFGCGGAGRAVAIACACAGADRIFLANRTFSRAERLAKEITSLNCNVKVELLPSSMEEWTEACSKADIVIQATSAGISTTDDVKLLSDRAFRPGQMVYDLVYVEPNTEFMKIARSAGARVANGLGMLLHQGALSYKIWTGKDAHIPVMRSALMASIYF